MGWYRSSSKFILDAFRRNNSKITLPRKPIQESISRTNLLTSFTKFSQPIFRNSAFQNGFKQNQMKSPFLNGAKRFYHFMPGGFEEWVQNPRIRNYVCLVLYGAVITISCGNLETVPYTKRSHFVLLPSNLDQILGDVLLHKLKAQFKGKILPASHPEGIRIQRVLQDIIEALQKVLRKEQEWSETRYSTENIGWHKEEKEKEMVPDDKWVQQIRKKGQEKGMESRIGHLEGLKWEAIVVDEPEIYASCLPGGKIVVSIGLLNHLKADAEIATILGHQVAHAVAKHSVEQILKCLWLAIFWTILHGNFKFVVVSMSAFFLLFPDMRRLEMEADYISLLLIASAGYDPRVAPQVHEKLGKVESDWALRKYLKNWLGPDPTRKERSQALSQAKVMGEALTIYREVQAE